MRRKKGMIQARYRRQKYADGMRLCVAIDKGKKFRRSKRRDVVKP